MFLPAKKDELIILEGEVEGATDDASEISLSAKQRIRHLILDGKSQTVAIEMTGIKPNSFYRHLARRAERGLDFEEAGITEAQWADIQEHWKIGMTDAAAIYRSRVKRSSYEMFMDLDPRREIERNDCMNDIEFRAKTILHKFLDPAQPITKDKARIALAVKGQIDGTSQPNSRGGGNTNNIQVNINSNNEPANEHNQKRMIDMAKYLVEHSEEDNNK